MDTNTWYAAMMGELFVTNIFTFCNRFQAVRVVATGPGHIEEDADQAGSSRKWAILGSILFGIGAFAFFIGIRIIIEHIFSPDDRPLRT